MTTLESRYQSILTPEDTFVLYTHTHGTDDGLVFSKGEFYSWENLANDILALPARNVIILTMSCHSGNLVNTLNRSDIKPLWINRRAQGRNLIVLTAVSASQVATPALLDGIRQNPFSASARAAFEGWADGYQSARGHKVTADGKTTCWELVSGVLAMTREKSSGKANPQSTGSYTPQAVLFANPPKRNPAPPRGRAAASQPQQQKPQVGPSPRNAQKGGRAATVQPQPQKPQPVRRVRARGGM